MFLFFFPRVEGGGVAEIRAVARGYRGSMTDGHGVDKAVPEGLGLALDFGAGINSIRAACFYPWLEKLF
jgi:hypothetical protein